MAQIVSKIKSQNEKDNFLMIYLLKLVAIDRETCDKKIKKTILKILTHKKVMATYANLCNIVLTFLGFFVHQGIKMNGSERLNINMETIIACNLLA